MNPTTCLRSMLVCLLKGDDPGAADGAAQLSAWIMDTAREARSMAKAEAQPEPEKPSPCDLDGIPFATSKPTKPVRSMGPAVSEAGDLPPEVSGPDYSPTDGNGAPGETDPAEVYGCDCHPNRDHASLEAAERCERTTEKLNDEITRYATDYGAAEGTTDTDNLPGENYDPHSASADPPAMPLLGTLLSGFAQEVARNHTGPRGGYDATELLSAIATVAKAIREPVPQIPPVKRCEETLGHRTCNELADHEGSHRCGSLRWT